MSIEKETKHAMENALRHLKEELKNLRTARANPGMVDSVPVSVYGATMRLKDIANITTPEARQLLITPFDQSNVTAISKGIEQANLGLLPAVDGNAIRIQVPPMDTSTRKEIVKQCKRKGEEGKIAVREIRRKQNELVRKKKSEGELTEDVQKKSEKKIQELTDQFCSDIDQACAAKEKEILEI
ncbi:MAG: ribosome recycling factor [Chlamydiota bacterium]